MKNNQSLKILFVIPDLGKGGAERVVLNISNQLASKPGNKILIITFRNKNLYKNDFSPKINFKVINISFHFSLYKKNQFDNKEFIKAVNEFQPNIIHSHLYFADLLTHTYHYKEAIYVSHQHNSEVPEYYPFKLKDIFSKSKIAKHYEFLWLKKHFKSFHTSFIACSKGTEDLLNNRIGFGRILTLPNAIPLPELDYTNKTLANEDIINIIWVGRFSDAKRPLMAVEIAKKLMEEQVNFHLTMVGNGEHFKACEHLIIEYNLQDKITLTGIIDEMDSIYKNNDLMIHTAEYEGLPMVFIEANAYGIPIITSDCMPNNEIIEPNENGFILKEIDAKNYVNKIKYLISNVPMYEKMSKSSIRASQKFGILNYVDKLVEFYYLLVE